MIQENLNKVKIGDKFRVYYQGIKATERFETITRIEDKSVYTRNRMSWNTFNTYIKNGVLRMEI